MEKTFCCVCGKLIDKSDTHETWVTIKSKCFWMNLGDKEQKVKGRTLLLCGRCGIGYLHQADEAKEQVERLVSHYPEISEEVIARIAEESETGRFLAKKKREEHMMDAALDVAEEVKA